MYTLKTKIQPFTTEVPLVLRVLFIHLGVAASKNEKYSSYRLFLLKHLDGLDFFWDLSGFTLLHLTQIWQSVAKPKPFLHKINPGVYQAYPTYEIRIRWSLIAIIRQF